MNQLALLNRKYFSFPVLNLISFSIIAFGYITMYGAAKTTSLAVGRQMESRRAEAAMARRMTLIVATDAACWVPIILLGVLSLTGTTVPKQVRISLSSPRIFKIVLNKNQKRGDSTVTSDNRFEIHRKMLINLLPIFPKDPYVYRIRSHLGASPRRI